MRKNGLSYVSGESNHSILTTEVKVIESTK